MTEDQKPAFAAMMNFVMTNAQKQKLDKDGLRLWWSKFEKYELAEFTKALDAWVDSSSRAPSVHDIMELCRHKVTIHARIQSPINAEGNKAHAAEIKTLVTESVNKKHDFRRWAKKILKRVENGDRATQDIAIKFAKESLRAE